MNATLSRLVVHGRQEIKHLDEAVGLHESGNKTVGLRAQSNLEAVEAARPLSVLLEAPQRRVLEARQLGEAVDVELRIVAEAGVAAEAAFLAAVNLPFFLLR